VFNDTFTRLEASFAELKQFTADASHELRTPLTALRSVGEVALRETRDPAAYREAIGSMLEETDRLARVVDTLLMLSRWESGRVAPEPETLDLAEITSDVMAQLAVLAEERQVTQMRRVSGTLSIRSDAVMARQAIVNVLDNAIKFTREGGTVTVEVRREGREQQVVIDDEGPGIPASERARVTSTDRASGHDDQSRTSRLRELGKRRHARHPCLARLNKNSASLQVHPPLSLANWPRTHVAEAV